MAELRIPVCGSCSGDRYADNTCGDRDYGNACGDRNDAEFIVTEMMTEMTIDDRR